jgi:hypothetical protein
VVALAFLSLSLTIQQVKAPEITSATLDLMLKKYLEYGLQLPPADAPLIAVSGYGCAYLLGPPRGEQARVWVGTSSYEVSLPAGSYTLVPDASKLSMFSWGLASFEEDATMAFALIEHSRGHERAALAIAKRNLGPEQGFRPFRYEGLFVSPAEPQESVACLAFSHFLSECVTPGSDRSEILIRMQKLISENSKLSTTTSEKLIRCLTATVSNRYVGSDEKERLIDALCECTVQGIWLETPDPTTRAAYRPIISIADQGFEIIPTLINHVDDERLTRAIKPSLMNNPTDLWTVGQACSSILSQLKGFSTGFVGSSIPKRDWETWWQTVQARGEREYCADALAKSEAFPSPALIRLAKLRYPDLLLESFNAVMASGRHVQVYPFLDAMRQSKRPRQQVIGAALRATASKDLDQVHAGIWCLQKTDQDLFTRELITMLRRVPNVAAESSWNSREASSHSKWATATRRKSGQS